jgi:diamine N-acetyltransferase
VNQYFNGQHVSLRALEPEDLDFLYSIENDPSMWDISNFSVPYSKYLLKQYIADNKYDMYADQQLRLIINDKENNKPIGTIDITDFSPHDSRAMIGIAILKEYQSQGIGFETLQLLDDYIFNFLHFHQVYAYIAIDNESSLSLFSKCGFVKTAVLKQWLHINSDWVDVVVMQKIVKGE